GGGSVSVSAKWKARANHHRQLTPAATSPLPAASSRSSRAARAPPPPPRRSAPARRAEAAEATTADAIQRALRPTGLPNVAAIARRDLTALFVSPVGWVVAGVFTFLVSSFGFYFTVIAGQQASMDGV